uniref:glucan 1,3-beta-glucosidase n=1 Tax=Albugo laibachii Nc14 TaxID=890382 RepID=F0W9D4_9STRA|nr:hypothetical protein ALNC14_038900 [Albugo laibachii Nc14]|eukprot:CCA17747.1 hypothetical protein ALNC14_038900 [Albugo laibachii Nc14]
MDTTNAQNGRSGISGAGPLPVQTPTLSPVNVVNDIIRGVVPMNGVTLPCLAIFEPWICQGFASTKNLRAETLYNEVTFMASMETSAAIHLLSDLRDKWIAKQTIMDIKKLGLNAVKLKVGYWLVEGSNSKFADAKKYVDNVMRWAEEYNIGVYLSLAAVPGCQNLQPVANCPNDKLDWTLDGNIKRTVEIIKAIATEYKKFKSFLALSLIYEPTERGIDNRKLEYLYNTVIQDLQVQGFDRLIMISPLLERRFNVDDAKFWCEFALARRNVAISISSYLYWDLLETEEKITTEVKKRGDFLKANLKCPIVVDEWSMATRLDLTPEQRVTLAENQRMAYGAARNGSFYGPFQTSFLQDKYDGFSYKSQVDFKIIKVDTTKGKLPPVTNDMNTMLAP